jgi:DNA-binding transcriptional MocR family regulator
MQQTRVQQIDAATGEILEGAALAVIFPKRRNGFIVGGWLAMAQSPLVELAKTVRSAEAWRVLALLLGRIDFENWINVSQADVARELGLKRQNVARALAQLLELGAVLEGPKVGLHRTYRLNPSYGWKGSAVNHHAALRERMKKARIEGVVATEPAEGGEPT